MRHSLFWSLVLVTIVQPLANADETTLQRFKSEAPQAWQQVGNVYEANAFVVNTNFGNGERSIEITQSGNNVRENGKDKYGSEETLFWRITNSYYCASVIRQSGTADYLLKRLEPNKSIEYESSQYHHARPSVYLLDRCLADCFVELNGFRPSIFEFGFLVLDAKAIPSASGEEFVVLELKRAYRDKAGKFVEAKEHELREVGQIATSHCFLTLSPARNWCIVKYDEVGLGKHTVEMVKFKCKIDVEFAGDILHPNFRRDVTEVGVGLNPQIIESRYSELGPATFKSDDFRLTSFGLVEPKHLLPKSYHSVYISAAIGLVALFGWLYLRRKSA